MKAMLVVLVAGLAVLAGCAAPGYDDGPAGVSGRYYYFDGAGQRQDRFYDPLSDSFRPLDDRVLE